VDGQQLWSVFHRHTRLVEDKEGDSLLKRSFWGSYFQWPITGWSERAIVKNSSLVIEAC